MAAKSSSEPSAIVGPDEWHAVYEPEAQYLDRLGLLTEQERLSLDLSDEEREPLDDDAPIAQGVAAVLAAPWRRLRTGSAPRRDDGVLALYRRMLELAARRGVAVNPADTPFERAAALRGELPEVPVDVLTRDLVAARYGGREPTPEALARHARALDAAESGR